MELKKQICAIAILVLIPGLLYASKIKISPLFQRAAIEYHSLRYASAIKLLKRVLKKHPSNVEAQEMIAGSYRNIRNYDQALFWYEKLSKQKVLKPEWTLHYAEALATKEKYEASWQWYRKYLELMASDQRASAFVHSYPDVSTLSKNQNEWDVRYTNINTAASEYSPIYYNGGLLFSSNRNTTGVSKLVFQWDDTPYTDLYQIEKLEDIHELNPDSLMLAVRKDFRQYNRDIFRFSEDKHPVTNRTSGLKDTLGRILSEEVKAKRLPGEINTKYHEGSAVLLPDGSLMFTRNNYYKSRYGISNEGINKLKIYVSSVAEPARISEFLYNSDEYSVGHPAINKDGTLLIFASDVPGGYGGTDLYYCMRTSQSDNWDKPQNMGKEINSEGNEMFPYLYQNGTLFFSSTGHAGLGGLDIFQVSLDGVKPLRAPLNLGSPVNSPGDDFGLIKSEDGKSGFFSSNRRGNDDIYSFHYHPYQIKLRGLVSDAKTKEPLINSLIQLRSLGKTDTLITNAYGEFYKILDKQTDYEISAAKHQYSDDHTFASSKGISHDSTVNVALQLSRIEMPQISVINHCDSLKRAFAVEPVYYDLDKSNIRDDALPELDKLGSLMLTHPEITVITASYCDSRASNTYNIDLSYRRGQSVKAYLVSKGISETRIKIEYYGESRLINSCRDGVPCTESEQQLNRRTEFNIILNGVNLSLLNCKTL